MERDWCIMTTQNNNDEQLREIAIAKLIIATGVTEEELRALGIRSDVNN